jgi:predicted nucleic acid-binding protein
MAATPGDVKEQLLRHGALGIDTMVFIYHFEDNPIYNTITGTLFKLIEDGEIRAVTSTLSMMEILVKPKRLSNHAAVEDYKYALTNFPNLHLRNLDLEVAEKAAEIRARRNLRPPDAVQLATCIVEDASAFITNDIQLRDIDEPEVMILKDMLE